MFRNIIFLTLLFICTSSHAQELKELYKLARDSQSIEQAEKVRDVAIKVNDKKVLASTYYLIGYLNKNEENFFEAVSNYLSAIKVWREMGKHDSGLADALINIGNIYNISGYKDTGLKYLRDALLIQEDLSDSSGMVYSFYNIGKIYSDMEKPDSAAVYYHKSLKISISLDDKTMAGSAYNALGTIYEKTKDYEKARQHYDLALEADNNTSMRARVYNNKGYTFILEENYDLARSYFLKALALNLDDIEERTLSFLYGNLAAIYENKLPDSALYFYEMSFSHLKDKSITLGAEYFETCHKLESMYKAKSDFAKADHYEQLQYEFGINMMQLQDELKSLNMQYQVEAATWKTKSDQQAAELQEQNTVLRFIILLLVLFFTGALIFLCLYYRSRKQNAFVYERLTEAYEPLNAFLESKGAGRAN